MPDSMDAPEGFDFEPFFKKAQLLATHYATILVSDAGMVGSGTLVNIGAIHGILTAHHVAELAYKSKNKEFSLCIRQNIPHRLDVSTSQFKHIIVGSNARPDRHKDLGPDLSFLMIIDAELT